MSIRRDTGGSDSGIRTVPDPASQVKKNLTLKDMLQLLFREGIDLASEHP